MLDGHNSVIADLRVSSQQERRPKAGSSAKLCIIINEMNSWRRKAQIDSFYLMNDGSDGTLSSSLSSRKRLIHLLLNAAQLPRPNPTPTPQEVPGVWCGISGVEFFWR